jgi:hypothetical protein
MLDRKLDDVTLAIYGDHDAGYGVTYAELDQDDDSLHLLDEGMAEIDFDYRGFTYGDPAKRKKTKKAK